MLTSLIHQILIRIRPDRRAGKRGLSLWAQR